MGSVTHSAFLVTCDEEHADAIRAHMCKLFSRLDEDDTLVSEQVLVMNGFVHIVAHSTGSKYGAHWDDAAYGLASWLRACALRLSHPEWAWIRYGVEADGACAVMCSEGTGCLDKPKDGTP
jgi:hypothetical protein